MTRASSGTGWSFGGLRGIRGITLWKLVRFGVFVSQSFVSVEEYEDFTDIWCCAHFPLCFDCTYWNELSAAGNSIPRSP